jgi:hypothetical protein
MTSLHHLNNSHLTNTTASTSSNSTTNALSPVIQRKIDSSNTPVGGSVSNFQRLNTNNNSNVNTSNPSININNSSLNINGGQIEFDATSIASISESSHWSGGGGDDLDNVALVNGSDTNTMENKEWCNYLRMSKNCYNSSEEEDNNNNEDDDDDSSLREDSNSTKFINNSSSKNGDNISMNSKKSNSSSKLKNIKNVTNSSNKMVTTVNNNSNNNKNKNETNNNKNNIIINDKNKSTDIITLKKDNTNDKENLNGDNHINSNHSNTNTNDQSIEDDEVDDLEDEDEDEVDYDDEEEDDDDEDDDDDLDDDDIWTIKPKLYSYYEKQFKTMQPNINGFITGSVAKPFFERSKLPLNELSKIWELSDVTRDGVLSFAEFCTAMHLVVLRVRNFDLPDELPAKLQPYAPLIDFNSETNLTNTIDTKNIEESGAQITTAGSILNSISDSEDITISSPNHSVKQVPSDSNANKPLVFGVKPQPQSVIIHFYSIYYINLVTSVLINQRKNIRIKNKLII